MMKRKLQFHTLLIVIVLLLGMVNCAYAIIEANPIFSDGDAYLFSDLTAEVNASTKGPCEEIVVSSMYLQRVNSSGSTIYSSTRISGPSESFSDASNYWGAHDFSGNATKGNYYRIKVTFSAEGESITRYSNIVYYN